MKSKEIEKLLRRYVPARTLLGSNREKLKAELQELHQQGIKNLNIPCVSKQRELLIAAAKGIYPHGDHKLLTKLIDKYLQGN